MELKKKHARAAMAGVILCASVLYFFALLRIFFNVLYPERVLREVVTGYFKGTFNKAVQCETIYMSAAGNVIIKNFNISITSDFNDNISLLKSGTAIIDIGLWSGLAGNPAVKGIRCHGAEIVLPKKYGRSYRESFQQVLNIDKLLHGVRRTRDAIGISIDGARLIFKESFREKQVISIIDRLDADIDIGPRDAIYSLRGRILPCTASGSRRGSFRFRGRFATAGRESFEHRIRLDNFDLDCLNDRIREYRLAGISLDGAVSTDMVMAKQDGLLSLKGRIEASGLGVVWLKRKQGILSNENVQIDIDCSYDEARNRLVLRSLSAGDDAISLEASGEYVRNDRDDRIRLEFKTNRVDLDELSTVLTPVRDVRYEGTLKAAGVIAVDFKKNSAAGTNAEAVVEDFILFRTGDGKPALLMDESSLHIALHDAVCTMKATLRPLASDCALTLRTDVAGWAPFRSSTRVSLRSVKMNFENLRAFAMFVVDRVFAAAYEDKNSAFDGTPFLQRPLGRFMNNSAIFLDAAFKSIFFSGKAHLNDASFALRLERGALLLDSFRVEGYEANYRLGVQGYFNSDQPYLKMDGKIDDFALGSFCEESGMKGEMEGKARFDFGYELSAARLSDMLDNAKGSVNIYIGTGTMRNTALQKRLVSFLRANGYATDAPAEIEFQDITLSISQVGENFWFSNFGMRGNTFFFNARGDYTWEGGLNGIFGSTVRSGDALVGIPLRLKGPLSSPCVDVYNKKDSSAMCFK